MEPIRFSVVTIFPEAFPGPLDLGVIGRARTAGLWNLTTLDLRDFTTDRHRQVDDAAYGGGAGMVLKPEPLIRAVRHLRETQVKPRIMLLSPQGRTLTQDIVRELATEDSIAFICGRYQGVDERAREEIGEELSIGDYILSGGELAAMVAIEAIVRTRQGVLGDEESLVETFSHGIAGGMEAPLYTRPSSFEGKEVPAVLREGNHALIAAWKKENQMARTRSLRPDLLKSHGKQEEE